MDRWRVVVAGIGVVLWGVGCGESEVRPGYSLPAEPGLDPAMLYGQLDQQQSCLNRRPPDVVYCETFLYVPCDSTVREATPVASVPPSCDATTRARTGRSDAIRWCLVGPHIEPAPTDESQGDGWAGWCAGQRWLESEFHAMDCASTQPHLRSLRALRDSGHDFEADCYAVDPVLTLEACFSHYCP